MYVFTAKEIDENVFKRRKKKMKIGPATKIEKLYNLQDFL